MVAIHPQYITDNAGQKLSVVIPIEEYTVIMQELSVLDSIRHQDVSIGAPEWHTQIVSERVESYRKNPAQALDFESAMADIDAGL